MRQPARTAVAVAIATLALAHGVAAQSSVRHPSSAGRTHAIAGGDVVPSHVGWDDGSVLAHLITGDSLEVALGELALQRSRNERIRRLARTVVREHGARLRAEREMAGTDGITPRLHRSDRSMDHLVMAFKELHPLSGADFDRAWLRHQITFHADHLAALASLKTTARDDELEDWVDASYAPARRHLERLNDVARTMGVEPGVVPRRQ